MQRKKPTTLPEKLRDAYWHTNEVVVCIDALKGLVRAGRTDADEQTFKLIASLFYGDLGISEVFDAISYRIRDVQVELAAGYVELCRATHSIHPANVSGTVRASFHEAASDWATNKRYEFGINVLEAWFDEIPERHALEALIKQRYLSRRELFDTWERSVEIDLHQIKALLIMELSQALIVGELVPPKTPAEIKTEDVRRKNQRAPLCPKCETQTLATGGGTFQHYRCPKCGHTGKRQKRTGNTD